MPGNVNVKSNQRFVMYIPNKLRKEIEKWVKKHGITMAEFGREAFETHLQNKQREERQAQLAETCRLLVDTNNNIMKEWRSVESENWPA